MEEFTPPIQERNNNDLIYIFVSPKGEWHTDAVKQAKVELLNRGYSEVELENIYSNYLLFLAEEEKKEEIVRLKNSNESYTLGIKVLIFFGAPFILFPRLSFHLLKNCGYTVSELKRGNYKIKYRQRLLLLIFGALFWILLVQILLLNWK